MAIDGIGQREYLLDRGVSNSGAIYGLQSTTVNSVGNSGTIAGQNQVFVNGQNVSSTGTLAAGVNANGQVRTSGDLTVVTGNRLTATGQNLADGNATLQAATVDLSGSKTAANGSLATSATTGDVDLTGATTQAGQQANNAAPGGTVRNDALSATQISQITAQQISINAAALSNRGGSIQQTGTNNTAIQIAGVLDNTGGTITTTATDLVIHAGSIANSGGQIHLAGNSKLSVATGALGNQAGSIGSNGVRGINAASIDNTGGVLASMGTTSVASTGALVVHGLVFHRTELVRLVGDFRQRLVVTHSDERNRQGDLDRQCQHRVQVVPSHRQKILQVVAHAISRLVRSPNLQHVVMEVVHG
ncbi:hypothetical protein WN985_29795 [Burkholderia pyrrocinia]|uniref:Adhesin HecA-like repeat protein n=1 Tax=Burkholderia pyrrocinia TaxID=60550 RepID=A0ABZ3BQB8_BURPY